MRSRRGGGVGVHPKLIDPDLVFSLVIVWWSVWAGTVCLDSKEFEKSLPGKVVWGVPGRDVELPCDVTPPVPSDSVRMIFWFKDTIGMPLYSLDARGGPLAEGSHLAMSDDLGSRSYFITDDQPTRARLRIQNVNETDEGIFRCRVDFNNSPTRNFQVNLTLVVQPSAPRVFDVEGREIKPNGSTAAGPFLEDHELFLSCQVTGGKPKPILTWWHNDKILDSVVDSEKDSLVTVNHLLVRHVPRTFRKTHLECRASSSELAGDIVRKVPLIVYLKPNKVKIVTPNQLLSIHKTHNLRCESSGSFPPAKLTWLLDGKPIRNALVTQEDGDSFTGSIISLNVAAEDDGKDLVCRADNPSFPGGSSEDRRQIHVAYPPKVAVKLNSGANTPVREGKDVTLRCEFSARPPPHSFSWYHDNHLVSYNEQEGILPVNHLLTLRSVNKRLEGEYACSAVNSEGETYSPPFQLQIQYPPRCRIGYDAMKVAMVPHEPLMVQCFVDSVPAPTKFSWTYSTKTKVGLVQGAKMQNKGSTSTLYYTPVIEDLESLSCWATNEAGEQKRPCTFYITPADIPESPSNCMLRNSTSTSLQSSASPYHHQQQQGQQQGQQQQQQNHQEPHSGGLEVTCIAGEDGGLHQSFVLEVSDISIPPPPKVPSSSSGVTTTLSDQGEDSSHHQQQPPPLYRVLGERPQFHLHSLQPGREYQVLVYAENAKGRSRPPVMLPRVRIVEGVGEDRQQHGMLFVVQEQDMTSKSGVTEGDPQSPAAPSGPNLTVILIALTAVAVFLIVGIVTTACVLACRRKQNGRRGAPSNDLDQGVVRRRPATVGSRKSRGSQGQRQDEAELSEAGFGEGFQRRSAQYRASMYGGGGGATGVQEAEERISRLIEGPDLILSPASLSRQVPEY